MTDLYRLAVIKQGTTRLAVVEKDGAMVPLHLLMGRQEPSLDLDAIIGDWDTQAAATGLGAIKVVPNPYMATATWEPTPIKGNRGARKIQFTHMPPKATVRIYTVRGELVQTLDHEAPVWDGTLDWNLKSKEGLDVAYGVYIYHVDSPAGEKIGKFALIK